MNDWGANMNNEEINLDFLDNIKLDENLDNDIVGEETKESYDFDIDKEEEEELDFDLNELINKIDSKIEELNKEESNDRENIDDVSKEIKIESNDELSSEKTSENIDDVIETKVDESSNSFNANELINKIDAKLEELNNEESNSETSIPIFEQPIVDEEQIESDTEQELSDVIETGANDVYVIEHQGKEVLVPAIKECILDINIADNLMRIHLMKGLI